MANARLVADLYANTSQFERDMNRAKQTIGNFGSIAAEAGKMAAAGLAVVATGLAALTVKQMQVIDQTSKLSRTLGVNIADFQALSLVAEEAGVGQEQLTVAFTKTQKAIFEAAQGTKTYVDAFSQIGLKAEDLINLNPDQQFLKIAEALTKIENPTARTALALEIFGKQGRAIIDLLPGLSSRIEEARAFQEKFNITLNEVDARKVEEANDTFARLGQALGGLGNTIAVELAPLITEVSNQLLNAGIDGEDFGRAVKRGIDYAAGSIDNLRVTILGLRSLILELGLSIDLFVLDASKGFFQLAKAARETLKPWQEAQSEGEALFANINKNAQSNAEKNIKRIADLNKEAENFKFSLDEVSRVQKEADVRAEAAVKNSSSAASRIADETDVQGAVKKTADTAVSSAEKAKTAYKGLGNTVKETSYTMEDFGRASSQSFSTFLNDIRRGEDALSSLRNLAISVLDNVLNSIQSSGISQIGGFLSSAIGGIFGQVSSTASFSSRGFGSILSSALGGSFGPGFATGIDYVPRDMNARIHRGEMIVPRSEADSIRRGQSGSGGAVYNIDARGASPGVEQKIENVMRQVLQLRADVPKLAVNSVDDATKRGML
jgi:CHAD domain-containing protein